MATEPFTDGERRVGATRSMMRKARLGRSLLRALIVASTVLASQPAATSTEGNPSADELLIVDCLLPGQIRKLGTRTTYVSPRRPVKTTALDCGIRGGEYVAYDRANADTALKVWLPMARDGDIEAAVYVGEIFEKGVGGSPDYKTAAPTCESFAPGGYNHGALPVDRTLGGDISFQ